VANSKRQTWQLSPSGRYLFDPKQSESGKQPKRRISAIPLLLLAVPLALLAVPITSLVLSSMYGSGHELHQHLHFPVYMVVPFAALLLAIALMPLAPEKVHHWWEENQNRLLVALGLGAPVVLYMVVMFGGHAAAQAVWHAIKEYISFVALLFTLYTIAGGIHLQGNLVGTPRINTIFLAIGTVLASVIGTTGAAMVLVRPMLRTNSERRHTVHIFIFFIFLVANIGGSLTPLGDPPLFLGFLRGVPFFWTLALTPMWLTAGGILLTIFYCLDRFVYYPRESAADIAHDEMDYVPLRLLGKHNILYLGAAIAAILLTPTLEHLLSSPGHHIELWWVRDAVMVSLALMSMKTTPAAIRYEKNQFNFYAMGEVAALFLGIFICMIPALSILNQAGRDGAIPVKQPAHFLWATGVCSGFLDNAPTYLVFVSVAQGVVEKQKSLAEAGGAPLKIGSETYPFPKKQLGLPQNFLLAIAVGSVFFGALTYIGNAPNFMVNAICVEQGIPMPSFLGYLKWSVCVLVPVYLLVTIIFFNGLEMLKGLVGG